MWKKRREEREGREGVLTTIGSSCLFSAAPARIVDDFRRAAASVSVRTLGNEG